MTEQFKQTINPYEFIGSPKFKQRIRQIINRHGAVKAFKETVGLSEDKITALAMKMLELEKSSKTFSENFLKQKAEIDKLTGDKKNYYFSIFSTMLDIIEELEKNIRQSKARSRKKFLAEPERSAAKTQKTPPQKLSKLNVSGELKGSLLKRVREAKRLGYSLDDLENMSEEELTDLGI